MQRTGEVTAVRGKMLEITFCRPADCEKCHACQGGSKTMKVMVEGQARVGDAAVVEMPTKTLVKASALAYGLPLAGLLGGLAAGTLLFPQASDLAGVAGGAIGLGATLLIVRATEALRRRDPAWKPRLVEIIPMKNEP